MLILFTIISDDNSYSYESLYCVWCIFGRHETVRKDVIRYTSEMADSAIADHSLPVELKQAISVMWKFLGLLCKQNGVGWGFLSTKVLTEERRQYFRQYTQS